MAIILENSNLKLHISEPLGDYRFSRFDWTGKIRDVWFQGIRITANEKLSREDQHLEGSGFYNEFGIESPPGFNDIPIGGWFHKIGIGLLKKEHDQYHFGTKYTIKPAAFTVDAGSGVVLFSCISEKSLGIAYILHKEVKLLDSGFCIHYTLQNNGEKDIITDEYVHNFIAIDQDFIGASYELIFPFNLNPGLFYERVDPELAVNIGARKITFNRRPGSPFFFSQMTGGKEEDAHWELLHNKTSLKISEHGNFTTSKVNLWGDSHVISPEIFKQINIKPGASAKWTRAYIISRIT